MKLYHFTSLFHLPKILREDLSRGEVPIGPCPYMAMPQAVNLTLDGTAKGNANWNKGNYMDKTRVRLVVDVTKEKLTSFRKVRRKFQIQRAWVRRLAPSGEHRHWYFAFDAVPTDHIRCIEIGFDRPGCFKVIEGERLAQVVETIEVERARLPIVETPAGPAFTVAPRLLDSWLIDGPFVTKTWPSSPLPTGGVGRQSTIKRAG